MFPVDRVEKRNVDKILSVVYLSFKFYAYGIKNGVTTNGIVHKKKKRLIRKFLIFITLFFIVFQRSFLTLENTSFL